MHQEFKTLIIERDTLKQLLTMEDCIESMDSCMRQTSAGNLVNPPRSGFKAGEGMLAWMPGYLGEPEGFACKLITLFPKAKLKGYSSHSGVTVYFEAETGQPAMIVDSGYLTAVRTAAASAVATRALGITHLLWLWSVRVNRDTCMWLRCSQCGPFLPLEFGDERPKMLRDLKSKSKRSGRLR